MRCDEYVTFSIVEAATATVFVGLLTALTMLVIPSYLSLDTQEQRKSSPGVPLFRQP